MGADPYCQSQHASAPATEEDVVTGPAGELANVFVYIKDIKGNFPAPATPVTIDQKGCQYHPHVLGIRAGQTLQLRFEVQDSGIGIAADHLPRIFEMFGQVESALERSQGGLGIGLSLAVWRQCPAGDENSGDRRLHDRPRQARRRRGRRRRSRLPRPSRPRNE